MKQPESVPTIHEDDKPKRSHKVLAGVALAVGLAGLGGAIAQGEGATKPKAAVTQETTSELGHFLSKIATPVKGDTFQVAHHTFTLKAGATVTDAKGTSRVLSEAIDGIQNPAWAPETEKDTLCFTLNLNEATCFDLATNKPFVVAKSPNAEHVLEEVSPDRVTRDHAVEATVTAVEPDGFAYGDIADTQKVFQEYIAGHPTE